jgi:UDP-N-acetyl-D-galactosamine dehydrogenase
MGKHVASETIKLMIRKGINIKNSKILILGFTFKEDCPDVRNTKVIDIISELKSYGVTVTISDPLADPIDVRHEYKIDTYKEIPIQKYDAIILAVGHSKFQEIDINNYLNHTSVLFDVKGFYKKNRVDGRL